VGVRRPIHRKLIFIAWKLLRATAPNHKSLDKSGVKRLIIFVRESGKCSRWEGAHRNQEAGGRTAFGFFVFRALVKE